MNVTIFTLCMWCEALNTIVKGKSISLKASINIMFLILCDFVSFKNFDALCKEVTEHWLPSVLL